MKIAVLTDMPFSGKQMYQDKSGAEVSNCRNNRGARNMYILQAYDLCHYKGSRSHDRRHYLTSGRGNRLDRSRLLRSIARLLHQRDSEYTRT